MHVVSKEWDEPVGPDVNLTPPVDTSALSGNRKRLFQRVEQINRAWLESMREMRRAEAEFSVRLFSCNTKDSALALCDQWLAKRREIIANEQLVFDESWRQLLSLLENPNALKPRRPNNPNRGEEH